MSRMFITLTGAGSGEGIKVSPLFIEVVGEYCPPNNERTSTVYIGGKRFGFKEPTEEIERLCDEWLNGPAVTTKVDDGLTIPDFPEVGEQEAIDAIIDFARELSGDLEIDAATLLERAAIIEKRNDAAPCKTKGPT